MPARSENDLETHATCVRLIAGRLDLPGHSVLDINNNEHVSPRDPPCYFYWSMTSYICTGYVWVRALSADGHCDHPPACSTAVPWVRRRHLHSIRCLLHSYHIFTRRDRGPRILVFSSRCTGSSVPIKLYTSA